MRNQSPLDRPLSWTEFPDKLAFSKIDRRSSLRNIAKRIRRTRRVSKGELPWFKLAEFGDQPKPGSRSLRNNANMLAVHGIELDYDAGDLSWDQAWARLYEARLPALLYATRRYSDETPRFRVLLPTSRALPRKDRARLVARAYGVLKGTIDGASFTDSQAYYYGFVNGTRRRIELIDMPGGRYIDRADDLDEIALDKHGNSYDELFDPFAEEDGGLAHEPDVERIRRALDAIPASAMEHYGDWLTIGQALHHEFNGSTEGLALWDEASQRCASYDADELAKKWDTLGFYGGRPITIGTVYRLAQQHAGIIRAGLTFHTPSQCAAAPPRGYVWKGMLAPRDIASIFGAPGAGKSLIAPYLAYMTALGEVAFGLRTKQAVAFYVAAEDPAGLRQRIAALRLRYGDAPDFRVIGGVSNLFLEDSPDVEALTEVTADHKPGLIVIDTLAMAFPGLEENDAKSMGRVVSTARRLTEHGASVVLIHHDTKAEGSTPRGHSVLNGALDMAMHVKRDEAGVIHGRLTKNRNGSADHKIAFRIGVEDFGMDEDGDPITAAVVEELPASSVTDRVRLTAAESAALAKLIEMEEDGRVSEDEWRNACIAECKISGSENVESRRRAMRRSVQGLANKGKIETRDGFVSAHCDESLSYTD